MRPLHPNEQWALELLTVPGTVSSLDPDGRCAVLTVIPCDPPHHRHLPGTACHEVSITQIGRLALRVAEAM